MLPQPRCRLLQLAGEAHDVDQRRPEVVGDDVGEALDFVVGRLQVRRAGPHLLVEAVVGVGQFGV